jgi:hypothetical protein
LSRRANSTSIIGAEAGIQGLLKAPRIAGLNRIPGQARSNETHHIFSPDNNYLAMDHIDAQTAYFPGTSV